MKKAIHLGIDGLRALSRQPVIGSFTDRVREQYPLVESAVQRVNAFDADLAQSTNESGLDDPSTPEGEVGGSGS